MRGRNLPTLLALLAVFGLPVALLAVSALAPGWRWPEVLPARWSLRAVGLLAADSHRLGLALASSAGYSLAAALLSFMLCLGPSAVLARREFRGKALLEGLLLAPALVPSMVFAQGAQVVFLLLGLAETWAGVVLLLTAFAYPYMLRALISGRQAMDPRLSDCARNLGAGPLRTLLAVELPQLLPAALAGGGVVFLVAFSEYFLVFLIGGGQVPSFATLAFPYLSASDRALGAAVSLLFLAVPLALFGLIEATAARRCRRMGLW